ncbi:septum formation family protein [Micromonospora sp. WMMD812]|uniref:septum formation family protein n=1 Tax=Micromonospora sp. WMMD812 TaxID=3015152 RepID=UPI00248BB285|nr:septum formation family protein [Micromonospora sp. WMMD812]WBB66817.1 septum formation family protein [Micromonospora sp. WMMD812]
MRRRWRAAIGAALTTLVLAGCGAPGAGDGDLTDDWRPATQARQFAPQAGECHVVAEPTSYLTSYQPVDCASSHLVETFHIGTFTGDVARRPIPPRVGSAALRPAFAECDARAREFVGGDWRAARLSVQVSPTSPVGWQGGSRWFRCDIFELNSVSGANGEDDAAVTHVGSLRNAVRSGSPVLLGCMNEDNWGRLLSTPCATPHQFEYAGVWTASDVPYEQAQRDEDGIHARCRTVIAHYAKLPVDGRLRYRTGTTYRFPSGEAWARGDRGVRCYFWSGGRPMTRSVAGGGPAVLPVN